MTMLLTIIIPSKNEAENISRSINTIMFNNLFRSDTEIILVDSGSDDKTVDIARAYPVKILQLKPKWPVSASAARYIGGLFAKGEFIFFIDADMTLEAEFLAKGIDLLRNNNTIAGVSGLGKEMYIEDGLVSDGTENLFRAKKIPAEARFLGGAALYRKTPLLEAGGFDPFLRAGEENELAQRLRRKGYRLMTLPIPMIRHYTARVSEWSEFNRKKKAGLFFGIGQSIRKAHGLRFLLETLWYYKQFGFFALYAAYAAAMVTYAWIKAEPVFLAASLLPLLLLFLFLLSRKKKIGIAYRSLLKWVIMSFEIVRGILARAHRPRTYPRDPLIIQGDFNG